MKDTWGLARLLGRCKSRLMMMGMALLLTACATPDTSCSRAQYASLGCCHTIERYPDWLIEMVITPPDGRHRPDPSDFLLRDAFIGDLAPVRAVLDPALRPMDVILQRYEGRVGGLFSPGMFSHASLYLGTEAQLRAAGVWHDPALAPWRAQIADGYVVLDAMYLDVHLRRLDELVEVDALAVFRPRLSDAARRAGLRRGIARMGVAFDSDFRLQTDDALFCTELVNTAMPDLNLPTTPFYGRQVILPDAIAMAALNGTARLDFVGYLQGSRSGGVVAGSAEDLAARITGAWQ